MTTGADWTFPPNAEEVSSVEAAQSMGYSNAHFLNLMRKYGVTPKRVYQSGCRVAKFWNPAVIRQVKAAHRLSQMHKRHARQDKRMAKDRELAKHQRRATRQETERLKILQRVAKREGITVKELAIAKGLQEWYRSLPPKLRTDA